MQEHLVQKQTPMHNNFPESEYINLIDGALNILCCIEIPHQKRTEENLRKAYELICIIGKQITTFYILSRQICGEKTAVEKTNKLLDHIFSKAKETSDTKIKEMICLLVKNKRDEQEEGIRSTLEKICSKTQESEIKCLPPQEFS